MPFASSVGNRYAVCFGLQLPSEEISQLPLKGSPLTALRSNQMVPSLWKVYSYCNGSLLPTDSLIDQPWLFESSVYICEYDPPVASD